MGFKDTFGLGISDTRENEEIRQIDVRIQNLEQDKRDRMLQFGEAYFFNNKDEEKLDEFAQSYIQSIKELEQQSEELQKKKLFIQGLRLCDKCHAILSADSVFCNKCGNKLEELSEEIVGRKCRNCGIQLEDEAVFCQNCGTKVVEK